MDHVYNEANVYKDAYNERMKQHNLDRFANKWEYDGPGPTAAANHAGQRNFAGSLMTPVENASGWFTWSSLCWTVVYLTVAWFIHSRLTFWFDYEFYRRRAEQDGNIQAQDFYTRWTCFQDILFEILFFPFRLCWALLCLAVLGLRRLIRPFLPIYYFVSDFIHAVPVFIRVLYRDWTESPLYNRIWHLKLVINRAITVGNIVVVGFSIFLLWFFSKMFIIHNAERPQIMINGHFPDQPLHHIQKPAHRSKEIPGRIGGGPAMPDFGSIGEGWPTNARWQHLEDEPKTWTIWADKHCSEVAPHTTHCIVDQTYELSLEPTEQSIWDSTTDEPLSFSATVTDESGTTSTVEVFTSETSLPLSFTETSDTASSEVFEERLTSHTTSGEAVEESPIYHWLNGRRSPSWPFGEHTPDTEELEVSTVTLPEPTSVPSTSRFNRFKHTITSAWTWEQLYTPWGPMPEHPSSAAWEKSKSAEKASPSNTEEYSTDAAKESTSVTAVSGTTSSYALLSRMLHLYPGTPSSSASDTRTTSVAGPTPKPTSTLARPSTATSTLMSATSVPVFRRLASYVPVSPLIDYLRTLHFWSWSSSAESSSAAATSLSSTSGPLSSTAAKLTTVRYGQPVATPFSCTFSSTKTPPGTDFHAEKPNAEVPLPTPQASETSPLWASARSALAGAKSYIRGTGGFFSDYHENTETRAPPPSYSCSDFVSPSCTPPAPGIVPGVVRPRTTDKKSEVDAARPAPGGAVTYKREEARDRYEETGPFPASPEAVAAACEDESEAPLTGTVPSETGTAFGDGYWKQMWQKRPWFMKEYTEPLFADSYSTQKISQTSNAYDEEEITASKQQEKPLVFDATRRFRFNSNLPSGQTAEFLLSTTDTAEHEVLTRKVAEGNGVVDFELEGEAVRLTSVGEMVAATPGAKAEVKTAEKTWYWGVLGGL